MVQIHSAFRAFDELAAPQGLYAINEYGSPARPKPQNLADWELVIQPAIQRLGYEASKRKNVGEGRFSAWRGGDPLEIELVRISKIKVRLYGNTYRIDPHHDFAKRWNDLRLAGRIRSNANPSWYKKFSSSSLTSLHARTSRILLLIGFAKETRPFHSELTELHTKLGVSEETAIYTQEQWSDPHGRGFHTLCASWYWPGHNFLPNHEH